MRIQDVEVARIEQTSRARSDNDSLEAIYAVHSDAAMRLAYVLTGDRAVAEDLAHEAFVKLGRKIFRLHNPEHARNYLLRTVINLTKSRFRRLKTERHAAERTAPRDTQTVLPDVAEQDRLWRALLRVPARQRAALFLRYYQDLSEAQTADALDCSVSAVKSLVNRGLKELRKGLEGTPT